MRNNKAEVLVLPIVMGALFTVAGISAIWHIPAWSKAKAEGKTAEYQAQKMWPQQAFSKLPGGDNYNK